MEPMTDELKETIIRERPDGIWLVLAEENPPNIVTAHDLLSGEYRASAIPFQRPVSEPRHHLVGSECGFACLPEGSDLP